MPNKIKPVLTHLSKKHFFSKTGKWVLRHGIAVLFCVAIVALGTVFLAYSSLGTTTIGKNISTDGNLTVSGDSTLATTTISALSSINNTIIYVKSGQTIQSAIDSITDATSTNRYTVVVPPGLHLVSRKDGTNAAIYINNYINLYLMEGAIIKLSDGQVQVGQSCHVIQIGDGSTELSEIFVGGPGKIDGNYTNQTQIDADDASRGRGIYVYGPIDNITIREITFVDILGTAITVRGIDGNQVENLHTLNNKFINVGEGILFNESNRVIVEGNIINTTRLQDGVV